MSYRGKTVLDRTCFKWDKPRLFEAPAPRFAWLDARVFARPGTRYACTQPHELAFLLTSGVV